MSIDEADVRILLDQPGDDLRMSCVGLYLPAHEGIPGTPIKVDHIRIAFIITDIE